MADLYENRLLSEGYPDLERLGVEYQSKHQEVQNRGVEVVARLGRLIDLSRPPRKIAVIGCGSRPASIKNLLALGHEVVGMDILAGSAQAAREYLGDPGAVLQAPAEALPLPDRSVRVVLLESVLEHVDSPIKALAESYRVLADGGVLYVYTTNRLRFSLLGRNGEFRTPFFHWFSPTLRECYVHHHLHFEPRLANFTSRPAVHWFTYAELCQLGRWVGFGQFYSPLDLADPDDPSLRQRFLRRHLVRWVKRHPWLRALALRQFGNAIIMLKRDSGGCG